MAPSGNPAAEAEPYPPCWPRMATKSSHPDIADCGFGTPGVDFLASRIVRDGCRSIITNPPYGEAAVHEGQARSPKAMLDFLHHALALTASVQGQLALLVRLQWIAGKRVAEVMALPRSLRCWC